MIIDAGSADVACSSQAWTLAISASWSKALVAAAALPQSSHYDAGDLGIAPDHLIDWPSSRYASGCHAAAPITALLVQACDVLIAPGTQQNCAVLCLIMNRTLHIGSRRYFARENRRSRCELKSKKKRCALCLRLARRARRKPCCLPCRSRPVFTLMHASDVTARGPAGGARCADDFTARGGGRRRALRR